MKMTYLVLALMVVLYGCGLLGQNTRKTAKTAIDEKLKTSLNTSLQSNWMLNKKELNFRTDSIGADYKIYFWPKGQLNLSAGGGLIGEFDSVLMVGKSNQLSSGFGLSNQNESVNQLENSVFSQDHSYSAADKSTEKKGFSTLSIIGILIILIALLVFVAKMRRYVL